MAKLCNSSNAVVEQWTHDPKLRVQILQHWQWEEMAKVWANLPEAVAQRLMILH